MSSLARAHIPKPLEKTSAVGLVQRTKSPSPRQVTQLLSKPPTRTSADRFVRRRIVRVKLEVLERVILIRQRPRGRQPQGHPHAGLEQR